MKAWHFLRKNKKLRYGDNRIVKSGETYEDYRGRKPEICRCGMHGSKKLINALEYSSGPIICRVDISGNLMHGFKYFCGRYRKVLWMFDASDVLHKFGCINAKELFDCCRWNPDINPYSLIEAKYKWINGEITNRQLCYVKNKLYDQLYNRHIYGFFDTIHRLGSISPTYSALIAYGGIINDYNSRLTSMIIHEAKRKGLV